MSDRTELPNESAAPDASAPTVAVFRPDDDRLRDAVALLESLGAQAIPDPMLAVEPTGERPRTDADYAILTSKTGAELVSDQRWDPNGVTLCAIGPATTDALRAEGYAVDLVPEEFTSSGLVATLADEVDGSRVEIARSDHGSERLLDGLEAAGAYLHETVLYRLARPDGSGESAELAAVGDLDAACFTSSLTVEHFLEAAAARGVSDDAVDGLERATVGAIGSPTAETLRDRGIEPDLVASEATFEALATETLEALR
ncbi:uroporphyrinogen-III synthase [Natrarchaeobius oligotrophus]|uniref:Uroporphyrinogen-III synthase n=1 Tax=Natrarchaeobius chitinivorans TaxID=1679083 RepID=A0A3N6MB13_NATCH|nr:uroporphyrinogen-III synthase [Natrarchaeobius chitinivorans]RQH01004.1 uroporphyrinogen-III synthase [Natrarchaeobius chitinivorans]